MFLKILLKIQYEKYHVGLKKIAQAQLFATCFPNLNNRYYF